MAKLTITDKRENYAVDIGDIMAGEIFNFDGRFFILVDDKDDLIAVDLENGEKHAFVCEDPVVPVYASLIIE